MIDLAKYGDPLVIHEVDLGLHKRVSLVTYHRELAYAYEQALDVCQWIGEDREGQSLTVTWVMTPNGHLLAAYEIQGR